MIRLTSANDATPTESVVGVEKPSTPIFSDRFRSPISRASLGEFVQDLFDRPAEVLVVLGV
jgi:hypothetical protein